MWRGVIQRDNFVNTVHFGAESDYAKSEQEYQSREMWQDTVHKDIGIHSDDIVLTEEQVDTMTTRLTKIGDTS